MEKGMGVSAHTRFEDSASHISEHVHGRASEAVYDQFALTQDTPRLLERRKEE